MSFAQLNRQHSAGFSLVEIMVGMVIALISTLIVMQVFAAFEGQKRTTTSGSDAQTNGGVALYTIERDVRMGGYGLSNPAALGCPINRSFEGVTLPALTLSPITITNGTGNLPDTIQILASNKGSWSVPARITDDHSATADQFFINSTIGMAEGDLLIAFEAGKDCTMLQITGIPPSSKIQIQHANTSPWNPPGGLNIFPAGGYTPGAQLFNLGSLMDHTYSLDAGSNLVITEYSSLTNTSSNLMLVPDIVNLQAEYGFDTRTGAQTDARVDTWSPTMITADDSGAALTDAEATQRMYAVRFALVARSGLLEKPAADGACSTTTSAPSWSGGTISVNKNPDGTANANWQCYRYKTFETTVPLRNMIWRQA
jgi:type IV pilus assembly protein PilW